MAAVAVIIGANALMPSPAAQTERVPISEFRTALEEGAFSRVEIRGERVLGTLVGETSPRIETVRDLRETLAENGLSPAPDGVVVEVISEVGSNFWLNVAAEIIPFLIFFGIMGFMLRRMAGGGGPGGESGGIFSFGKSRAKSAHASEKKSSFADVAGCEEAKEALEEIVDFLKNPKKYQRLGAKIPRGVLLVGPPGTGKTLLARAVAGEAGVPFLYAAASEFVEMIVGVGASRVRDLFARAKKESPAIIFIDELDAIGKRREGAGFGGGHDEREQTLNQILTEMDGFDSNANVIVMGATNRAEVLDRALLRPGRFDRRIPVTLPDLAARERILDVHTRKKPMEKGVDLARIARITVGFSGADLESLANEAAILAARVGSRGISQKHFEDATEKIALGSERKSMKRTEEEKRKTALHELGHAVLAHVLPGAEDVHKITIVSRGMSLGSTWMMPERDEYSLSKQQFLDRITALLGGMAAERVFLGQSETGVSDDLRRATAMARGMATRYGMSAELGPVSFSHAEEGGPFALEVSAESTREIEIFTKTTLESCLARGEQILRERKQEMLALCATLLEKETLDREAFIAALEGGGKPKRSSKSAKSAKSTRPAEE